MLTINLETLGVTEEALQNAILKELNMTPEQAIDALAEKFGVSRKAAATIASGDSVKTTQGDAKAVVMTDADVATIVEAGNVMERLFG